MEKDETVLSFSSNQKSLSYLKHSVQFSGSVVSDSLRLHASQHARPPCPSPTPGVYSNSCPSSWWCHPTVSSSVIPFSILQPFPASGYFPVSWYFISFGQIIGVSASTSVLPMKIQNWFTLGWIGFISLQSKGLSRVFSNTTVKSINSLVLSFLYSPTLTSIESVMPSSHLILCHPRLLLPPIPPSIRDFSNESSLRIR